jgi:hypothetical protein
MVKQKRMDREGDWTPFPDWKLISGEPGDKAFVFVRLVFVVSR